MKCQIEFERCKCVKDEHSYREAHECECGMTWRQWPGHEDTANIYHLPGLPPGKVAV